MVILLALQITGLLGFCGVVAWGELRQPNGSTDGRVHTCGFVTEDGVTNHLDAYQRRCS